MTVAFFYRCLESLFTFPYGAKMASTPSTLSTMLKMSVLYILQLFYKPSTNFYKKVKLLKPSTNYFIYKPSTNFYKKVKLLKPSTNYFIFYRISTNVEAF